MTPRPVPSIATWLLKLFSSNVEHESLTGDLVEEYQHGRGRTWYWRQVLAIVFLGSYRKTVRFLSLPHTIPVRQAFAVTLLIAGLSAVLLSDAWMLFLAAILGGVIIGGLKSLSGARRTELPQSNAPDLVRIDSSTIPISGGIGAAILIVMLFTAVLYELPELRSLAVPGILAGLVFAGVLRLWRRLHPIDMDKEWLTIRSK